MVRYVLTFLLALGIVSVYVQSFAQNQTLDSLQLLLTSSAAQRSDSSRAVTLIEIGRIQQRNQPEESRQNYQTALHIAERNNFKYLMAMALYGIGYTHYIQAHYDEALRYFEQSNILSEALQFQHQIISNYIQIGTTYWRQSLYSFSMSAFLKALTLAELSGFVRDKVSIYVGIANIYRLQENYDKALEYLFKAVDLCERNDTIRFRNSSYTSAMGIIGTIYVEKGEFEQARLYTEKALKVNQEIREKRGQVYSLYTLGLISKHLGKYPEAFAYYNQALSISDETKNPQGLVETSIYLSQLHQEQGAYRQAILVAERAAQTAQSIGARDYRQKLLTILAQAKGAIGEFQQAFIYSQQAATLKDSLIKEDGMRKTLQREAEYESQKKQQEITILQKTNETQTLQRNFLLMGFGLISVLVYVLIRNNEKKKRANAKLAQQKLLLEEQSTLVQLANTQLQEKNIEITEAHSETQRLLTNVNDSIRCAKRIQDAMLPSTETLNLLLPDHCIFFRPKDVVSGDFYWCREQDGKVFVAAVDCTGHGVPGAFMSLIGNALLNDIVQRLPDPHPDLVLNELHHELQTVLRQKETNNDDGMDMCLCMIDMERRIVEFAGAMNPLYAVIQGVLREFKGTPEELGGRDERSPVYGRHVLDVSGVPQGATMLYLTTDGYKDQYNEVKQRFMPKRLRPLLEVIASKPLEEQPRLLGEAIDAHRGEVVQVDDMLVLGVRL